MYAKGYKKLKNTNVPQMSENFSTSPDRSKAVICFLLIASLIFILLNFQFPAPLTLHGRRAYRVSTNGTCIFIR